MLDLMKPLTQKRKMESSSGKILEQNSPNRRTAGDYHTEVSIIENDDKEAVSN